MNVSEASRPAARRRLVAGVPFTFVAMIEPARDHCGDILRERGKLPDGSPLPGGPFCRFDLSGLPGTSGVYVITVDDRVVYVGQTTNLARRFGTDAGYGAPQPPRGVDTNSTNRRVNKGILEAAERGRSIAVWFHATTDTVTTEDRVLSLLDLPWNEQGPSTTSSTASNQVPLPAAFGDIAPRARRAKDLMARDPVNGATAFAELLRQAPGDGFVWLCRAEAMEHVGNFASAAIDYQIAERLLPFPNRRREAAEGYERAQSRLRRPPTP